MEAIHFEFFTRKNGRIWWGLRKTLMEHNESFDPREF